MTHCSDIDLKLYRERGEYFVELLNSPLWRRSEPQHLVLPPDVAGWIRSVRMRTGDRQDSKQLGITLFTGLLPSPINNIWNEARGRTGDEGVLRLRLDIRDHELMNIPWELVHDESAYLALSTHTPVVRYLHEHASRRPVTSPRPLNVLLVSSTPRDMPHLAKTKQEIQTVTNSLRNLKKSGLIGHLEILKHVTTEKLRAAFAAPNESYDVVHYIGHGAFRDRRGYLILEDDFGNASWKEGESVGDLFRNTRVRLLFLNACDTGIPSPDEWLIGVAHAAHAAGIPAVIAMQQTILDNAAAIFAGAFYRALARNQPLETCLVAGREVIKDDLGCDSAEWAIPLMFSNAPPGLLCSLWEGPVQEQKSDTRHAKVGKWTGDAPSEENGKARSRTGTNPAGRSFLAYQRSRSYEAGLLIAALHDRGIPTWENISELDEEQGQKAVRNSVADPATSNAILWLTPEIKSDPIRNAETELILKRGREQDERDGFFIVPVLAGGLDLTQARTLPDPQVSLEDLRLWKMRKVEVDPIGPREAAELARHVLNRRVAAIHHSLTEDEPLRMELYTRPTAAFKPGTAFILDWVDRFDGRLPKPGAWDQFLWPALKDVSDATQAQSPGRPVEVNGLAAIPMATALGCTFLAPRGVKISWRQPTPGRDDQLWSINVPRQPSGFSAEVIDRSESARDVALLVSVAANVEPAFEASREELPPFRGIVHIAKPGGDKHILESAGHARDVAEVVIEGIRSARNRYRQIGCVHLFMSVPVGLAMMIGQLLNTFGLVQTYEHIPSDAVGRYHPAMLLYPSGQFP